MKKSQSIDRSVVRQKGQFLGDNSEENELDQSSPSDFNSDAEETSLSTPVWRSFDHSVIKKIQRKVQNNSRTKADIKFEDNISEIRKLQVMEKFLLIILREQFRNFTFFSFNGQAFDHQYVVEAAYHLGLSPQIICRGQKIFSLSFPPKLTSLFNLVVGSVWIGKKGSSERQKQLLLVSAVCLLWATWEHGF